MSAQSFFTVGDYFDASSKGKPFYDEDEAIQKALEQSFKWPKKTICVWENMAGGPICEHLVVIKGKIWKEKAF